MFPGWLSAPCSYWQGLVLVGSPLGFFLFSVGLPPAWSLLLPYTALSTLTPCPLAASTSMLSPHPCGRRLVHSCARHLRRRCMVSMACIARREPRIDLCCFSSGAVDSPSRTRQHSHCCGSSHPVCQRNILRASRCRPCVCSDVVRRHHCVVCWIPRGK